MKRVAPSQYRDKAFAEHGRVCYLCDKELPVSKLEVHHRDGNRHNNDIENLVPLCDYCHNETHCGRTVLSDELEEHPHKYLDVKVDPNEFEQLKEAKGNRTWHQALMEEFGVVPDEE